jgi:WD40 repeat protein
MLKRLFSLLLLLLLPLNAAFAQPEVVTRALADLNARLGTNLAITDLDDWRWSENVYDDASLGCAQEGTVAAQVVTIGYQITLVYGGTSYDYRADEAGTALFLCSTGTSSAPTMPPLPTPTFPAPSDDLIGIDTASGVAQIAQLEAAGRPILAWSLDGNSIAVAAGELPLAPDAPTADVLLYDALDPTNAAETITFPVPVTALAYGSDANGSFTVSGHEDGTVLITPDEGESRVLEGDATEILGAIRLLAVRPDGAQVAVVTDPRQGVYVWDTATAALVAYYAADLEINALAFSPDNATLAWGDVRGFVSFAAPGVVEGVASIEQISLTPVLALAFDPIGGARLAVGSEDGLIRMWNVEQRTVSGAMDNGTDDTVNALAFSPDGSLLAAAGGTTEGLTRDNSIRLWDSTTFVVLQGLTGHRAAVRALAFNPDGTRLASVAEDDTLRLWGVAAASG